PFVKNLEIIIALFVFFDWKSFLFWILLSIILEEIWVWEFFFEGGAIKKASNAIKTQLFIIILYSFYGFM
ncbi:MAG: hypothetical protein B6I18_02520, partial [Bacteroidetes bacterium 4572_112]